jgi:hypothetical protein
MKGWIDTAATFTIESEDKSNDNKKTFATY